MSSIIPDAWTPQANMKRIHLHWTAGNHKANETDKKSYHILIEGDGKLVRGLRSIDANAQGSGKKQASHTLSANTGAIGVSLCCMVGAKESPFHAGTAPMTETQWKTGIKVIADLSQAYDILVTPKTILTHAEVQPNLNIRQKNKWDITRLAFDKKVQGFNHVGNKMRQQVAEIRDGVMPAVAHDDIPDSAKLPRFRVTGVAPSTLNFRSAPNGDKIGSLPERTRVEFISAVRHWWQVRTAQGFVGWVWSDFLKPV